MQAGLVSVIVTTYKRDAAMLCEALDSVFAQTYRPIEVLLVDDNALDSPFAAANAALEKKYPALRYIKQPGNTGAQKARNAGIRACEGEFCAFLDDDDLWLPDKIALQVALFQDPAVGLVYCDGWTFRDGAPGDVKPYHAIHPLRLETTYEMELTEDCVGTTSQAMVRRSAFEAVGLFDEALKARQDYEMWLRLTKKFKALAVAKPLFKMRVHAGERITGKIQNVVSSYETIEKKYWADFQSHPYAHAMFWYLASWKARDAGGADYQRAYLRRSFRASPAGFLRILWREGLRKYGKTV